MTTSTQTNPLNLSDGARAVWRTFLAQRADCRDRAVTDADISRMTGLSHRDVIEFRKELRRAKILVVTSCSRPFGSWIIPVGADLADAYTYLASRRGRLREDYRGYRDLKACVEHHELEHRRVRTNGQINMPFADADKRLEAFTR